MTDTHSYPYNGHDVIDERGQSIGRVVDVVYGGTDGAPSWLVVDPGMFRSAHYVPVHGCYQTAGGDLVVPFDKHWIKDAPKAASDHIVTAEVAERLARHYSLS